MLAKSIFLLNIASLFVRGHEHAVIPLSTSNFEHATQAASGQTTGFWLVYFAKETDLGDHKLWNAFAEEQREVLPWLIHAFVNTDSSPEVAQRFGVHHTPYFILFRNRKLYRFKGEGGQRLTPEFLAELGNFAQRGWKDVRAEKVPPESNANKDFKVLTLWVIIAGASAVAVVVAVVGSFLINYLNAATPINPKHE